MIRFIHVAPHSHPYQETFAGRFGGQSLVLRHLLETPEAGEDHHVVVLAPTNEAAGGHERLHVVGASDAPLKACLDAHADALAATAADLAFRVSDPGRVVVCFHYWDGASVLQRFSGRWTRPVRTAFVSHSLQMAHVRYGLGSEAFDEQLESERFAAEAVDVVVVMSNYEAQLVRSAGLQTRHLTVASKGLSLPSGARILTGGSRPLSLLCGGRCDHRKNLVGFAGIFDRLSVSPAFDGLTLQIAADIEGLAESARVRVTGFVDHARFLEQMRTTDIVVVPSFYEPFGLVILEGVLAGKVVLAPHLSAAPDLPGKGQVVLADFRCEDSVRQGLIKSVALSRAGGMEVRSDPATAAGRLARQIVDGLMEQ